MSAWLLAAVMGGAIVAIVGLVVGTRWRRLERARTAELRRVTEAGELLQADVTEVRRTLAQFGDELGRIRSINQRLVDERGTGDWERVRVTPRSPREPLTRVQRALSLLDSGYRSAGVERLTELVAAPGRQPRVQAEAAFEYAAWRYRAGDLDDAHRYLALARTLSPNGVTADQLAFEVDLLCERGRADEALRLLDAIDGPPDVDLQIRRADVLASCDATWSDNERAQRRLLVLNAMFVEAGLTGLVLADPERPLCLDNLAGTAPPRQPAPDSPLVTVIMPAFDSAETIGYALRSVLEQTWTSLEVVVVDDGSTDDTVGVARRTAATDDRVRIESQPRRGAYAARNLGLRIARGEYITVNDADDWSHPEKIARQMDDLLAGVGSVDGPVANRSFQVRVDANLVMQNPADRFRFRRIAVNYSSLLFRRSIVDEIGIWDEVRVGADAEFIGRLQAVFGDDALRSVIPDAPLSFVLKSTRSLTNAGATALRSLDDVLSPRSQYRAAYRAWHRSPALSDTLPFDPERRPRPFALPAALDLDRDEPGLQVDLVLAGDLSRRSQHARSLLALCDAALARGLSVALLNLPGPLARPRLHDDVIDRVNAAAASGASSPSLVHLGTPVEADLLVCWGSAPLGHPLEAPPAIDAVGVVAVTDHPVDRIRVEHDLLDTEDGHLAVLRLAHRAAGSGDRPNSEIVRVAADSSILEALVEVHGERRRIAPEVVPLVALRREPFDEEARSVRLVVLADGPVSPDHPVWVDLAEAGLHPVAPGFGLDATGTRPIVTAPPAAGVALSDDGAAGPVVAVLPAPTDAYEVAPVVTWAARGVAIVGVPSPHATGRPGLLVGAVIEVEAGELIDTARRLVDGEPPDVGVVSARAALLDQVDPDVQLDRLFRMAETLPGSASTSHDTE